MDHFKSLSRDLILEIMSKLDGCSLVATASTCTHLHDTAEDERLWQMLCHQTWPSTSARRIPLRFKNLFADAFPVISSVSVPTNRIATADAPSLNRSSSPQDFISFVDIYYKGDCIFSKVVDDTIQSAYRCCGENSNRFLCYPFKLSLLGIGSPNGARYSFQDSDTREHVISLPLVPHKTYDERQDYFEKIAEDIRLSWILLDWRKGKAVNLSSWKPQTICKQKPSDKEHIICSRCIIPQEDS